MAEIKNIRIDRVLPNPYRNLKTYPWIENKITHLMRSIEDLGIWESIIARQVKGGYEQAFGHHRLEAARRLGITTLPVIVRDLSDEEMVQFMGRENGEDYSTDFLVLLNTWEGAIKFLSSADPRKTPAPIEIAALLGWTQIHSKTSNAQLDHSARACAVAHGLITAGHIARKDLRELSVSAAEEIVGRTNARIEAIEKMSHRPRAEKQERIQNFVHGAKKTADDVRAGIIPARQIRANVDNRALESALMAKPKAIPDFEIFGRNLADTLRRMLKDDVASKQLANIAEVLPRISDEDDRGTLRMLQFELEELGHRADTARKKLIRGKVVPLSVEKK